MFKVLCKCVLLISLPFWAMAHATSVVFLNPGNSNEAFWVSYSRFMQVAANDLGLQLRVRYSERNPQTAMEQAREELQGKQRPDYLVLVNEQYVAPEILRLSQGSGVKLLIVNNALTADQLQLLGDYPSKFPNWIGSIVANDDEGGYLMLKELLRQHGPIAPGQTVDLLAFSGVKITPAAQLREQGLRRALAENPQVRLRQLVYGEWSQERAYEQATQLLKRYPHTALIWSANDEMAFGAMKALQETGRVPGKDVLLSAVNTSSQALAARIDGRLSALVGGHFTLGGWAMVVIHDHAHGVDTEALGVRDMKLSLLQLIDPAQARHLEQVNRSEHWTVDFKSLSAQGKPAGYRYPFGLSLLMP